MHVANAGFMKTDQEKHSGALIFGLCVKHLVTGVNKLVLCTVKHEVLLNRFGIAYRLVSDAATFKAYMADRENDKVARQAFKKLTRGPRCSGRCAIHGPQEHYGHASQKTHTNRMNFLRNIAYSPTQATSKMNLSDFDMPRFTQPVIIEDVNTSANSLGVR